MKIKYVVLDIEGTMTSISFVHDVLFPYVANNVESFLQDNWDKPETQQHVNALRSQAKQDVVDGLSGVVPIVEGDKSEVLASLLGNIRWQMAIDRKIGALKGFQGYMWRGGFESGAMQGDVYDDVVPALKQWTESLGCRVIIYSSGSIEAQKLLFKYNAKGDLLHFFSGNYDTGVGLKIATESYVQIANDLGVSEADRSSILFVSDNVKELIAADKAGIQAAAADRPGNPPLPYQLQQAENGQYIVLESGTKVPVVKSFTPLLVSYDYQS
ncbi:2,3-diketo-5-methylthio-1-phosphopentane phosphatase [Cladochytrium replicatum]|nr:2,3-diketo-5-methylthio-1-phosphopentane phosphatase [Cladochytrium replicatum]